MRLKTRLTDREHELTIDTKSGRTLATVDGRAYELEVHSQVAGDYLIFNGAEVYECKVRQLGFGGTFQVTVRGRAYRIEIRDPKKLRAGQNSQHRHHGTSEIVAPMPGKVVRVLVEVGAEVEVGQGVLVVEAMKMQNEMKSLQGGKVVSIRVAQGETVNAGDVLAVVE
ncbi:MAG TPA: biotin/lipoyl-containing protein [Pyrinomonadaceae bacterium]|nr:biotin/lipoyl-containing protein [Pyrinomonadaceae bacterium]